VNAFIKKPPRASRRPSAPGSKPKRTRVEQRDATRAGILDAARAHFEERGFEGANVRAIAAEAGVAAGTVLLHFTDKRDLLHAALFEDLERTADLAIRSTPQADLRAQLRHIARCFFDYYAARPALSRTLLEESLLAKPPMGWAVRVAGRASPRSPRAPRRGGEGRGHARPLGRRTAARGVLLLLLLLRADRLGPGGAPPIRSR
jgi:AcrR family transcriptional regulator